MLFASNNSICCEFRSLHVLTQREWQERQTYIGTAAEHYGFDMIRYTFLSCSGYISNNRGHRNTPSAAEKWPTEFQPILQHAAIMVHKILLRSIIGICMPLCHSFSMASYRHVDEINHCTGYMLLPNKNKIILKQDLDIPQFLLARFLTGYHL